MKPMATTKTVLSAAASFAASAILARTVINNFLPHQMRNHIFSAAAAFLARFSTQLTVTIGELSGLFPNQMYRASEAYLSTKVSPAKRRLCVTKQEDSDTLQVTMERGEELVDIFQGVRFRWRLVCREQRQSEMTSEIRFFQLSFHKQHRDKALGSYLPYIMEQFKAIKEEVKTIKIHTAQYGRMRSRGGSRPWTGVNLDHPATFDTLAMDAERKREVMEDLERFVRRKDYYRRVGKAWKRGYLLHGPPGTGKSSLIAAMANLLKFDVYDLELTEVQNNSALRTLLLATANRSILVVEDIDCTLDLQDRKEDKQELAPPDPYGPHDDKVTLSGLLNFIDGLWSSCGDERIIVFTTNHKEKLDPALLRPGRMDMHIHMSYCTPSAFKTLLSNYHMVDNHLLVEEIEGLLQEAQATPAEVAEELMKSDILDIALHGLIGFLQGKKAEPHETESKAISTRSGIGRSRNRRTRGGNVTIRYSS